VIIDLSETERNVLLTLVSTAIKDDRFPLSPRVQTLQQIQSKLEQPPDRKRG
jgi:hypothetical protein